MTFAFCRTCGTLYTILQAQPENSNQYTWYPPCFYQIAPVTITSAHFFNKSHFTYCRENPFSYSKMAKNGQKGSDRALKCHECMEGRQKKPNAPCTTLKVRPRTCYDNAWRRPVRCVDTIQPGTFHQQS